MMGVIAFMLIISSVAYLPTLEAICFEVKGLLAALFTPVNEDGSLNLEVIPQYAQYLKDNGVNGVVVAGTTGEGPTMNVSDSKLLLEAWMKAAPPLNLYVISTIGAVPLPDAQEMAAYSEEIGVDAILALPEIYYKPKTPEELVYYMEFISEAAPNTPLMYDHYPQFNGVDVDMVEFFELATEKIPNFKGLKSDLYETALLLRTKLRDGQKLFVGDHLYLASEVFMGFENFILAKTNLFPALIRDIIRLGQQGNQTQVISYYQRMVDLVDVITDKALKEAMPLLTGIDVGSLRPPRIPLSEEQKNKLEARLKAENVRIVNSYKDK